MRWLKLALGFSVLCLVLGCGGDGGGGPSETASSLTAEGWDFFEEGNHEAALAKFWGAIGLDPSYSHAYNGMGWSYAKLDSLGQALTAFGQSISNGLTTADPHAGLAPVYRDLYPSQFQNAVT